MDIRIFAFNSSAAVCKHCQCSLICSKGHNQWINMQTTRCNSVLFCFFHDSEKDLHTALYRIRNTIIITQECNALPVCVRNNRENSVNLIAFKRYGIHKSRSLTKWNCCHTGLRTWTVYTDWCIRHFLYKINHPFQCFYFYVLFYRCTYVQKCSARFCLHSGSLSDQIRILLRDCLSN